MIQSVWVIIYGNQKHSYLNWIKAEQLMIGKQLLVSTSLINPFGTSIIHQHFGESIKLIEQSDSILIVFFSTRFQRADAIMEFSD